MKINKLKAKLPKNIHIIQTNAAKAIKGGNDAADFIVEDQIDGF